MTVAAVVGSGGRHFAADGGCAVRVGVLRAARDLGATTTVDSRFRSTS